MTTMRERWRRVVAWLFQEDLEAEVDQLRAEVRRRVPLTRDEQTEVVREEWTRILEQAQVGPVVTVPRCGCERANLGLATTAELLDELRARIEVDGLMGGGGLDYTTVGGRPAQR